MSDDKQQYNTARDVLKVIAIIAMTADHASAAFLDDRTAVYGLCQFSGNFTIVIMCFFVVQGLRHTRSVMNYALRLLTWAIISEAPFYLLFGLQLNVLFTLLASLIIIYLINRMGWLVGIAALALFFPLSLICDWSIIAPVFTIIYYALQEKQKENISLIIIPASYFILRTILYTETRTKYVTGTLAIFLAALLIFTFSKKADEKGRGRIPGLVFYAYYPLHLIAMLLFVKLI